METIWKDIEGYEGLYQINNCGVIKSTPRKGTRGGIIVQTPDKNGYLCVGLNKNNKMKTYKVHRLVANAFISNPRGLPEVNHKDEIKTNNHVDNLEWCDHKYNSQYGTRGEKIGRALSKPVYSVDNDGTIEHFQSITEASKITGLYVQNICAALKGVSACSGNRKWYYENSQITNND